MAVIRGVNPTKGNPRPQTPGAKPPAKPAIPAAKPPTTPRPSGGGGGKGTPGLASPAPMATKLPSLGVAGAGGMNKPGGLGSGPQGYMRAQAAPVPLTGDMTKLPGEVIGKLMAELNKAQGTVNKASLPNIVASTLNNPVNNAFKSGAQDISRDFWQALYDMSEMGG